ncbi:MAG: hypothetical protein WCT10_03405 [Patescibacteria group bacterium]|jgi:hypothetical protein
MSRESSNTGRGEGTATTETFKCCTVNCENTGTAEKMFNVSLDPAAATREEILAKKVRCQDCAEKISAERGKRLREPGCGVYPLVRTLAKLTGHDPISAQRLDTIRWVEAKKQEREAARHAADRQQRIENARLNREEIIRRYARDYVQMAYNADLAQFPAARHNEHHDQLVCGLPVNCCRHDLPADRFITVFGEVVGICRLAAQVFLETFKELDDGSESARRLLSTRDPESAGHFADEWAGENQDE